MTLHVWDSSHYDGPITRATAVKAAAEGVAVLTAKVAEGLADTEGTQDDTTLAAGRDAGIPFLGGYFIPRSNATPQAQVDRWVQLADAGEPWWRDFPGWFSQIDLERWSYDNVPASVGIDCARRLRDKTQRQVVLYASHGQYADELAGWDGPLWNADYTSHPPAGFQAMYPGDAWQPNHGSWVGGWAPYSGREPDLLQYTSSAIIAGLTTCDASAYRGTVDQFRTMIGGHDMAVVDDPDAAAEAGRIAALVNLEDTVTWPRVPASVLGNSLPLVEAIKEIRTKVGTLGAPTQDQVDAAVAKVLTPAALVAALTAAGVTAEAIGAAVASHIHLG